MTNNFENGKVLYLKDNLSEKIIDSAVVTHNQFVFRTKISKFPVRVLVYNKEFSQWRDIWIENNKMIFDASESDFKSAKVTGSQSEDLSQQLYKNASGLSFEERNELEKKFVENNPNSKFVIFTSAITAGKSFCS